MTALSTIRHLRAPGIDLRSTLQMIGIYRNDPTHAMAATSFAKAVLTPHACNNEAVVEQFRRYHR